MNCVDAGNVLVHLFLQYRTQYLLTNKKLQYLLIIAQMSQLAQGKTLFDDDIKNIKSGFVLDAIADAFGSSSAIVNGSYKNMPILSDDSEFVLPYTDKKIFRISKMPTGRERKLLIKVFLTFGSYSEDVLGKYLNGFQQLRLTPSFQVVPKEKIRRSLLGKISKEVGSENVLLCFVKSEYLENRKASTKKTGTIPSAVVAASEMKPVVAKEAFAERVEAAWSQAVAKEQAATEPVSENVDPVDQQPIAIVKTPSEEQPVPEIVKTVIMQSETEERAIDGGEAEEKHTDDGGRENVEGIRDTEVPEAVVGFAADQAESACTVDDCAKPDFSELKVGQPGVVDPGSAESTVDNPELENDVRCQEPSGDRVQVDLPMEDEGSGTRNKAAVDGLAVDGATTEKAKPEADVEIQGGPIEGITADVPQLPRKTAMNGALAGLVSTQQVVVGKKYTVFVEVQKRHKVCEIVVEAPGLNARVPGVLNRISNTLYSYTFVGVAGDVRIFAKVG